MTASQEAGRVFRKIRIQTRLRGSALRQPPGAKVSPTGLTKLNVGGTEELVELAGELGFDPERIALTFGVEDAAQNIAFYIVSAETDGAVAVRLGRRDRTATAYLHDLFQAVPKLRPSATRRCPLTRTVDSNGETCLVLSLNSSLRTGVSGRQSEGEYRATETGAK